MSMSPLDCAFANLTLSASVALAPSASRLVYDALQLSACGFAFRPPAARRLEAGSAPTPPRTSLFVTSEPHELKSPADGSRDRPFASLADALEWRRRHQVDDDIMLQAGMHYVGPRPIVIGEKDSGMSIVGEPGAWLSGGVPLVGLDWARAADGRGTAASNTWVATLPVEVGIDRMPSLNTLTPHRRLTRARYPNGDLETVQWGYASPTRKEVSLDAALVSHWHPPAAPLARPSSTYADLTDPSNPTGHTKADSTMDKYNAYGSGRGGLCDEVSRYSFSLLQTPFDSFGLRRPASRGERSVQTVQGPPTALGLS